MSTADKILVCRDCGATFVFTVGEQSFYSERGFVDPVRCPSCRATRRQARMAVDAATGGPGMTAAPRPERRLYPVVCAECGRETFVPFEPRSGRPVYCRDCYQRMRVQ